MCRRQFLWNTNDRICLWLSKKRCLKIVQCWLPIFSGFNRFLAHLSTKCSEWAVVMTHRPSASVRSEFSCLHSSIYKYEPISTKINQNVCDHNMSDKFDYAYNQTRTFRIICPWIRKIAIFDFAYTLVSANVNLSAPNLVTIYMTIRSNPTRTNGVISPWMGKIAEFDFVHTLDSTNIIQSTPNLVLVCKC